MKFTSIYVIALAALLVNSVNEVSSSPLKICKNKSDLTDGKQKVNGSCSTTVQGEIPSANKMTSTLITFPENGAVLDAGKPFDVKVIVSNLETGKFSDPENSYYTKPQKLNGDGIIEGHTHVTIQELKGKSPPDPKKFAFFEGLNDKADDGHLSVSVVGKDGTPGLPAGHFRICTMAASFSHQPVLMPVAKRGSQDDCIRIKVKNCK